MKVTFASTSDVSGDDAVVVFVDADPSAPLSSNAAEAAALTRLLGKGGFNGKCGEVEVFTEIGKAGWLVATGISSSVGTTDRTAIENAAAHAYHAVKARGPVQLVLRLPENTADEAAHAAAAVRLAAYRFDRYRSKPRADRNTTVTSVLVITSDPVAADQSYAAVAAVTDGILLARDLVNEPPNILYPQVFADRCEELRAHNIQVEVLNPAELEALGMRMLLGVGKGSKHESKLVTLTWRGAEEL